MGQQLEPSITFIARPIVERYVAMSVKWIGGVGFVEANNYNLAPVLTGEFQFAGYGVFLPSGRRVDVDDATGIWHLSRDDLGIRPDDILAPPDRPPHRQCLV